MFLKILLRYLAFGAFLVVIAAAIVFFTIFGLIFIILTIITFTLLYLLNFRKIMKFLHIFRNIKSNNNAKADYIEINPQSKKNTKK